MFENLWKSLREEFGEGAMTLLLLLIMTATYPLLSKLGFGIFAPLLILADSEQIILQAAEILSGFSEANVISISAKPKEVEKHLASGRYGIVMFRFQEGRYTSDNFEIISADCEQMGKPVHEVTLKIVFAIGPIPRAYEEMMEGRVYINGGDRNVGNAKAQVEGFLREWIPFCLGHIAEIKRSGRNQSEDERKYCFLKITGDLLKMFLNTTDLTKEEAMELENMADIELKNIYKRWRNINNPESYVLAFQKAIYSSRGLFFKVLDRECIARKDIYAIDDALLYDERFYYLLEKKFAEVCGKIEGIEGSNYVKRQLAASGVLLCEGKRRVYYTQQVSLITDYGEIVPKRLVKIVRKRIDDPRRLPLKDILQIEEGDEEVGRDKAWQNGKLNGGAICENL